MEIELLSAAIDRIVMQEVLEDELLGTLPKVDELNDSNKIYRGKVSVLLWICVNRQNCQRSIVQNNL